MYDPKQRYLDSIQAANKAASAAMMKLMLKDVDLAEVLQVGFRRSQASHPCRTFLTAKSPLTYTTDACPLEGAVLRQAHLLGTLACLHMPWIPTLTSQHFWRIPSCCHEPSLPVPFMRLSWVAVQALKHYFLMDRGDLLECFLDSAEHEMAKPLQQVSLIRLQTLLDLGWLFNMVLASYEPPHTSLPPFFSFTQALQPIAYKTSCANLIESQRRLFPTQSVSQFRSNDM